MEFNKIIFPAPRQSYNAEDFPEKIIWVPKILDIISIPCLFLQFPEGSSKIMIYFHGNAEDLGLSLELVSTMSSILRVHILAVEYPGYGIYDGKPSAESILADAECVYSFIISLGIDPSNIIVFGRSIGSGPATYIARKRKIGCLMLMSAYTSIKDVAKHLAGSFGKSLIKERFENKENMPFITCPTFLVHGIKDKIIPYNHSQILHDLCKGPSSLFLPSDMTHNSFDYCDELIFPISNFLNQTKINVYPDLEYESYIYVPWPYFLPPASQKITKKKEKSKK